MKARRTFYVLTITSMLCGVILFLGGFLNSGIPTMTRLFMAFCGCLLAGSGFLLWSIYEDNLLEEIFQREEAKERAKVKKKNPTLKELKRDLASAVDKEDYKEAVRLREEIKIMRLKKQQK